MKKKILIAVVYSVYTFFAFVFLRIFFPCLNSNFNEAISFDSCSPVTIQNAYLVLLFAGFIVTILVSFLLLNVRKKSLLVVALILTIITIISFYIGSYFAIGRSAATQIYLDTLLQ